MQLGHYRLQRQLASSAYGVVWRAAGPLGSGDVAIKLVNAASMERAAPGLRERWLSSAASEIAFLETLEPWDERHIVRLLDSGWHQGLPVMALELLDSDLGRHIAAAPPPFSAAVAWTAQLNQALAKVHQHGWRHLDLKPANVLVDARLGRVKLADFGTNRRLDALQAHSYCGTANWQAPEQFFPVAGGGYVTGPQSDYFSLGALFYYMVTAGTSLAFCTGCGQAYREQAAGGATALLARHGGALPATLLPDEEELFAARIPVPWRDAALTLLRALLAPAPGDRPGHAVQISRMLAAARPPALAGHFDALPGQFGNDSLMVA